MFSRHIRRLVLVFVGSSLLASVDLPSSSSPGLVVPTTDSLKPATTNSSAPVCAWEPLLLLKFPIELPPPTTLPTPHVMSPFDIFSDFDIDLAEKWFPAWLAIAQTATRDPSRLLSSLLVEGAKMMLYDHVMGAQSDVYVAESVEHHLASFGVRFVLDLLFGLLGCLLVRVRKIRVSGVFVGELTSWAMGQLHSLVVSLASQVDFRPTTTRCAWDLVWILLLLDIVAHLRRSSPSPPPPPPTHPPQSRRRRKRWYHGKRAKLWTSRTDASRSRGYCRVIFELVMGYGILRVDYFA
ncbi:hypothetical protein FB45DRAFT_1136660 [Roridomyces roridus]|uniref:Uncharacterized protein n=1 Tax=Roridomyces roridus TaxID=1738132 RepID=A0AAD7B1A2_9AGAR|nr:hypothetical protein FB45DRAFT_1136660 [Roridomyces roridus]